MPLKGLTDPEVSERAGKGLINKTPRSETKTIPRILFENIFSVFNFIIFGIIIFVLIFYFKNRDDRLLLDSIGILLVGVTNTAIALYQEIKSKVALDKVSLLLKKRVVVLRNGKETEIEQNEIVKDDIIKVNTGDQIIVDGEVAESRYLEIDESLLTGESLPIEKSPGDKVLSGSFCTSGSGYYKAVKVGEEMYANSITRMAKKYKLLLTPLQKKINFILEMTFLSALVIVGLETWSHFSNPGNVSEDDFIRRIATILISLIPQGLVFFASVTYALGVYRISKLGAIIEKLNAVESFSSVRTVCMDKTGTITENNLRVKYINNISSHDTEEELTRYLGTFVEESSDKNATIRAIKDLNQQDGIAFKDEIPFRSENKYSVMEFEKDGEPLCLILGGYDVLYDNLDKNDLENAQKVFNEMGLSVYRNLLFGRIKNFRTVKELREAKTDFVIEPMLLVSISDTPREDAGEALELFDRNGIDVKILSGDSADSISSILTDIGRKPAEGSIITGSELAGISKGDLSKVIKSKEIFARLKPDQKLAIIRELKKEKIYTAMIGDGVNDLPAIKESDMGIAMEEGSQITKEVADIVLLKNKFSLLPRIFDEGNKIVNSVNYISKLFLTKNFIVIYIAILAVLFLFEFPLTPRRVALINMFGISLPAYLLMLRNTNVKRSSEFIKDVFTYIVLAGAVIIIAGYLGILATNILFAGSEQYLSMVMLSIMIFISISNYVIVAVRNEDEKKYYYISGIILVLLYIFFAMTNFDVPVYNLIKIFYEIDFLPLKYWVIIVPLSLIGSIALYFTQTLRERIFKLQNIYR
ncbi:MAG: HAD-IC family P-type ATPase [Ignavibacteriae bacterium]|nr:HAD-IC family P-type ATPase [Ignavibacteriota bacterium]